MAMAITQQLEQCLDPLPDIINNQYSINSITDIYNQPITDDILHQMMSMIDNYPLHRNVLAMLYIISSPASPLKKELLGRERTLHQLCPKGDCHCRPVTGTSDFRFPALWHLDDVIPSIIGLLSAHHLTEPEYHTLHWSSWKSPPIAPPARSLSFSLHRV